jgi:hypothetical protein
LVENECIAANNLRENLAQHTVVVLELEVADISAAEALQLLSPAKT